jgi:hypothetical protein
MAEEFQIDWSDYKPTNGQWWVRTKTNPPDGTVHVIPSGPLVHFVGHRYRSPILDSTLDLDIGLEEVQPDIVIEGK